MEKVRMGSGSSLGDSAMLLKKMIQMKTTCNTKISTYHAKSEKSSRGTKRKVEVRKLLELKLESKTCEEAK